jgi:hypothetical protein
VIVVKLMGGLGNQLFQYAFARALSVRRGETVLFDTSLYMTGNPDRSLEIASFAVDLPVADARDITRLSVDKRTLLDRIRGRVFGRDTALRGPYVGEPSYRYSPRVMQVPGNDLIFVGYWQSEKYFAEVASQVRKEIALKDGCSTRTLEFRERIAGHRTVSVHVRRGDYVSNPHARRIYRTIDPSYYFAAYRLVCSRGEGAVPVIFSDDPEWVRHDLALSKGQIVVDPVAGCAAEDMVCMSECDDHIIANSTFSWWGAWLDARPGKVVISPAQWFHPGHYSMRDLLPTGWLVV